LLIIQRMTSDPSAVKGSSRLARGEGSVTESDDEPQLVAAVDLGSNSFHLLVGRVQPTRSGYQVIPIDSLKESVRLASGLSPEKRLDPSSQARALAALQRFGERLRLFLPQSVRAVATNTFRVAKNGPEFLRTCEAALGFPIEIIAGKEEARLIYNGVAHSLSADGQKRLVIDIGGGSTELIVGINDQPLTLESVFVGCIRFSHEFFPKGELTKAGFREAIFAARKDLQVVAGGVKAQGWDYALGSSGTARAIADLSYNLTGQHGIRLETMRDIAARLVKSGSAETADLPGIKADRGLVLPGGLSILIAAFEELGIDEMQYSEGALRLGVLYDLVGRAGQDDLRSMTVEQFMARYQIDQAQAGRIAALSSKLWSQINLGSIEERQALASILEWSSRLLEIGHSVSHNSYHKHSAYLVSQSDMPGFSKKDQQIMHFLVLGHVGKLAKVQAGLSDRLQTAALVCLRLAAVFYRSRVNLKLPTMSLRFEGTSFELEVEGQWLARHPLTRFTLDQERLEWSKMGFDFQVVEVRKKTAE
jgi:exopolyphosphatase/guanosine-5'-triphosphate,3'-diphosphate pyrophosphatase